MTGEEVASYELKTVLEKGRYILKATMDDYNDAYMNIDIRSHREMMIPVKPIRMLRISHELPCEGYEDQDGHAWRYNCL